MHSYANAPTAAIQAGQQANPQGVGQLQSAGNSPRSEMETVCARIADLIQYSQVQAERLEQVDLRLTGGCPTKSGAVDAPRPVPNGKIALMSAGLDELFAQLNRAEQIITHLSQAI